ncbi:pimeloyl-ACP methyl ester carboxylesterase [Kitasatospora sp. GP30]|uniref:alpha/beta fold hydrolase n=1 Tax=Kitasatospora sp. GP30 TaxID=3035084 RepID=UPI000C70EAE5|nr:alpha/beta fold hydrolase [Kitasatospora sp. GP30]MDH6142225.1 pimeloyl-ACP methyl ester carboxylesterase [Kitasatospora sp. GP30]
MATFVLVPGTYHGGWWYGPIAEELRGHGHTVHALTLTGVGERNHLLNASINLHTHIEDIVQALDNEEIEDAILVGHSYGGMPITGAADRRPERIASLVYLDSFAPRDGESELDILPADWRQQTLAAAAGNGFAMVPPAFLTAKDARVTSHPLATKLQRIRLTGAHEQVNRRTYVHSSGFEGSPFLATYERLRQDPSWTVESLPIGHDIIRDAPDYLVKLLLAQVS